MMDVNEIRSLLPHRYPFLLVDRVTALEPGKSITAFKNVTVNEEFFQGHFPGQPIMPGVLQVEAMAQAGGLLAYKSGISGDQVYFMSINNVKFRKPVVPGDRLILKVSVVQSRGKVTRFRGEAFVDEALVCEAEFTAMMAGGTAS